eukprot:scaffold165733_cov17-Tisochrysis_lutea.AAC.3
MYTVTGLRVAFTDTFEGGRGARKLLHGAQCFGQDLAGWAQAYCPRSHSAQYLRPAAVSNSVQQSAWCPRILITYWLGMHNSLENLMPLQTGYRWSTASAFQV